MNQSNIILSLTRIRESDEKINELVKIDNHNYMANIQKFEIFRFVGIKPFWAFN